MQDFFDLIGDIFAPKKQTFKTNKGELTGMEIVNHLTYISYATQRDAGISHESCIKMGLGNDQMKEMYSKEQPNSDLPV